MAVVARALVQNEFIVPVPLDLSPKSAKKQSTLVIVTVLDNPPDKQQLSKVYAYYGKENCQKIIGKMPHQLEDKVVICVPAFCLANSIYNLENKPALETFRLYGQQINMELLPLRLKPWKKRLKK